MALADQDLGVWDGTDGVVLSHVIADTLGEGQETIAPRVHRPITTIMYTSLMLSLLSFDTYRSDTTRTTMHVYDMVLL